MYYSYIENEYVATSFSPARTDLAVMLLTVARREYSLLFCVDVYVALHVGCKEQLGCWLRELRAAVTL
jgi:hypothetical protein